MGEDSVSPSPEWELGPHIYVCHACFYSAVSLHMATHHEGAPKTYLSCVLPLLEHKLHSIAHLSPGHGTCAT